MSAPDDHHRDLIRIGEESAMPPDAFATPVPHQLLNRRRFYRRQETYPIPTPAEESAPSSSAVSTSKGRTTQHQHVLPSTSDTHNQGALNLTVENEGPGEKPLPPKSRDVSREGMSRGNSV